MKAISVSRPDWYVACRSSDLKPGPIRSVIAGTPVVLFRSGEAPVAMRDRCPHRNAPLSHGIVRNNELQCEYHGWRFASGGKCVYAAGIRPDKITEACHGTTFPAHESQGFVWVSSLADQVPEREPFRFPFLDAPGYASEVSVLEAEASVHAVAENTLDVPHTMYLHGGLFRSTGGREVEREVEVRNYGDRVEAEYFGEERPAGIVGRLLAPGGGIVKHVDQFILPSITVVDYRLGEKTHINVAVALTPVQEFLTRLYAVVTFRTPLPPPLVRLFLRPVLMKIFKQDAAVLARQSANIKLFGEERFATTDADTLSPYIARLLKAASTEPGLHSFHEPQVKRMRIVL